MGANPAESYLESAAVFMALGVALLGVTLIVGVWVGRPSWVTDYGFPLCLTLWVVGMLVGAARATWQFRQMG